MGSVEQAAVSYKRCCGEGLSWELSRVSGCRVQSFLNAFPPVILAGLAGTTGPARAGGGVAKVLLTAAFEVAELKPRMQQLCLEAFLSGGCASEEAQTTAALMKEWLHSSGSQSCHN